MEETASRAESAFGVEEQAKCAADFPAIFAISASENPACARQNAPRRASGSFRNTHKLSVTANYNMTAREPQAPASANMIREEIAMKKRLLAWLLLMAMLLTVGAVAAAETNPNAGLGYYPGTSEKGWISVE